MELRRRGARGAGRPCKNYPDEMSHIEALFFNVQKMVHVNNANVFKYSSLVRFGPHLVTQTVQRLYDLSARDDFYWVPGVPVHHVKIVSSK